MTSPTALGGVALPRPAPASDRGPLDDAFHDLVEARFGRTLREDPVLSPISFHHRLLAGDGRPVVRGTDGIGRAAARA